MELQYEYEPATDADKEYFEALNEACYTDVVTRQFGRWDPEFQRTNFNTKWQTHAYRKILVEGKVCGGFWVEEQAGWRQLRELQIHPRFQGRGIGTHILRWVISGSVSDGRRLRLRVLHENRAFELYRRMGFEVIDDGETHFVMEYKGK
ncbi:MAG TPA: GNAT family N-acetyltransferase [Pseudomonadales bacterium]|nr:GNAT family N-acetyltransferase [Pseudomonadales bacterium]